MTTTAKQDAALREMAEDFGYSQCHYCKHNHSDGTCDAFSDSIPGQIFAGEHDHRVLFPGQENDIVFERVKDKSK